MIARLVKSDKIQFFSLMFAEIHYFGEGTVYA